MIHPTNAAFRRIELGDGSFLLLDEAWLSRDEADRFFDALRRTLAWRQESIRIMGRTIPQPRLTVWYGDPGSTYVYSGLSLAPLPWTPELADLRARVSAAVGVPFDSVLANLYRSGEDSMGMHADDEPELGPEPVIASLSLGAVRRFVLAHRKKKSDRLRLDLPHGSLLVMAGSTQRTHRHGIPKQPAIAGERINLTFRRIVRDDAGRERS